MIRLLGKNDDGYSDVVQFPGQAGSMFCKGNEAQDVWANIQTLYQRKKRYMLCLEKLSLVERNVFKKSYNRFVWRKKLNGSDECMKNKQVMV